MCVYMHVCIGAAIKSSTVLLRLKPIFDNAALASGLCLKPVKCVIVPVDGPVDGLSIENWKGWLSSYVPGWKNLTASPCAKYLVMWLGPEAGGKQWLSQTDKWLARTRSIFIAGALGRTCTMCGHGGGRGLAPPLCTAGTFRP